MANPTPIGEMENIKREMVFGLEAFWTQQEINGNTYVVYFRPPSDELSWDNKVFIEVWATPDGSSEKLPDNPTDLGSSYHNDDHELQADFSEGYRKFIIYEKDFSKIVSQTINEAVCELEEKQEKEQSFATAVQAAIDANKEVHEGIDYQLEQDAED